MSNRSDNEDRIAEIPESEIAKIVKELTAYAYKCIRSCCWRGIGSTGVLPDGQSAPDVVQRAFEKILDGAKWDQDKPLKMVLAGLVRGHVSNQVLSWENRNFFNFEDKLRADGRSVTSAFDLEEEDADDPLQFLIRREDDDAALELLDTLSPTSTEYKIVSAIFDGSG